MNSIWRGSKMVRLSNEFQSDARRRNRNPPLSSGVKKAERGASRYGREIRQGKHTAENPARTEFRLATEFSRQMNPFRISQAQHQSPSVEVVRDCHRDLIIARFHRQ